MTKDRKAESAILASVRKTAAGLQTAGLLDRATMSMFDTLCQTRNARPGAKRDIARSR